MRHLLVTLLFLIFWEAGAQVPFISMEHLTTREGLPSNDVLCFTKDKEGFLWIGTGRNICRYDGYGFLRLDGFSIGYATGASTDSDGNVYTSVDTRGLYRIDHKTMKSEVLIKNNYDDPDQSNDLHQLGLVDSRDQVWMCDYTSVKRYDPGTKKIHRYTFSESVVGADVYEFATFIEDNKGNVWVVSTIGLYRYDRRADKLVGVLGKEAALPQNRIPISLYRGSIDSEGTIWLGGYGHGLIRYSPQDQTYSIFKKGFEHNNVLCVRQSIDENGRKLLFIGTSDGISVYYPERDELYHLPELYKNGVRVRDMYDDKENGILWIATSEGVYKYRYRNIGIQTVTIPANIVRLPVQITAIHPTPNGTYLLGLSHSGVIEWTPGLNHFRLLPYPINASTQQIRWLNDRPFAFTDKGIFVGDLASAIFSVWEPSKKLFKTADFRDGLVDKKGRLWIANMNEGLKVFDPKTNLEIKMWDEDSHRPMIADSYIRGILEGDDGKIWVSTCSRGLFYFDEKSRKFTNIEAITGNFGLRIAGDCINGLQKTADGSIIIGSWGGVAKLSRDGQIKYTLPFQTAALNDTYCANIAEAPGNILWFSTNEGIHIGNPRTRAIRYLTTIEGLKSNAPQGFYYNRARNELILGHTNALNVLGINKLTNFSMTPIVAISSVEVKGNMLHTDLQKQIILQPDENSIAFSFSTLNFEPASKNMFSYQLDGYESSWVNLGNKRTVSFANLPAGAYVLRVKASNSSGQTSNQPFVVKFSVKPYFINTWFFRIIVGLSIAALIVGMMRWRVNALAERTKLDLQIAEWRLKALQSQMNPHFLFNSLNSVQNYLLTNRGVEGAKYLSKFSKLVRRIMENSNHQYLPFEKIIDTLKMYVEIESFRFNHEFSFTFDIEENEALLDTRLPPMLLQPYVENAIWHGLMPKEGDKKLAIRARLKNRHIICTIEDNGVGRGFSPRTEGHISRGQEMTKGIFESLRRKDSDAQLELIDLFDSENKPAGTRVIMIIPTENV